MVKAEFIPSDFPAWTAVGVTELVMPELLCEIRATAVLKSGGFLTCETRTVAHKQRKYYRITPEGRNLLNRMRGKIKELYREVIEQ